jgi:hypothetical protein
MCYLSIDSMFSETPDTVFLQEVVAFSFDLIRQLLPEYEMHSGEFMFSTIVIDK